VILLVTSAASPPSAAGTVTGQVKDSSGAVIGKAAVTLTNSSGASRYLPSPARTNSTARCFYDTSQGLWNSRNPFLASNPYPNFHAQTFGGNISGPISKRASFFFDFERRLIDDNAILNAIVFDPTTLRPYNDRGFTSTPQQRTTLSPRFDHPLSANE
jgi:hypothetical protein